MNRGRKRVGESKIVMPGPRRTTESRRRRSRLYWLVALIVLAAIGWLGYRELAGVTSGIVEFSGP
ncbi:MAG: hypothetical protein R3195_19690 [Gemmatimonadota bacterium]|nr:hypothetical protein [Gemmatimonadota bacterium]